MNTNYLYIHTPLRLVKILGTLCYILCLTACESFLEVDYPEAQLAGEEVFEEEATATAAVLALHAKLRDNTLVYGSGLSHLMGLYADEFDYYGQPGQAGESFYTNTVLPASTTTASLWNNAYHVAYSANAVIEGLENSAMLEEPVKNQLLGEALFVRALVHFYLTNLYGNVPYTTTTDHSVNENLPRLAQDEVYQQLITDLLKAKNLLSETYPSAERTRPNRAVATALLARAYLYNENWQDAEMQSSEVLQNTSLYSWEESLDQVFLKESTTAIWQFKPQDEGVNTREAASFIFTSTPPPSVALREDLMEDMEPGDARRSVWIKEVPGENQSWYHPYKYRQNGNTGTSLEYSVVFRLAEQYLIRAEARVQQGNLSGAKEDLNRIRNRAGLTPTPANGFEDMLEAILQERRFELFSEHGHRWFDLQRSGKADAVLAPLKPGWQSTDRLLPLPEAELLANPNLQPQNPGY